MQSLTFIELLQWQYEFETINFKSNSMEKTIKVEDLMKNDFLRTHYDEIAKFAYSDEKEKKLGYTLVWVNKDSTIDSIDFIEGNFNKKEFSRVIVNYPLNPLNDKVVGVNNNYFVLLYENGETIMFYRTYITLIVKDWSKSQNLPNHYI
jgi:hypothetical protein